jgi:hypothetical protein
MGHGYLVYGRNILFLRILSLERGFLSYHYVFVKSAPANFRYIGLGIGGSTAWGFDVNLNGEGEQAFFWVHCSCQKQLFEQNSEVK